MASLRTASGVGRRHGRNISLPMSEPSARGPLEAINDPRDDPLSRSSLESLPSDVVAEIPSIDDTQILSPPSVSPQPESLPLRDAPTPRLNLRFLQDHGNYHAIPADTILPTFVDSQHQPPPGVSLDSLIKHGHFRRAAELSLEQLLSCHPAHCQQIFELLYTRLACLILNSRAEFAAHEAAVLSDFLAPNTAEAKEIIALLPWELRLLLIRLQTIASPDGGRRSIMGLYTLAGEVRSHLDVATRNGDQAAADLHGKRLRDLGLRVADGLVEMGELDTATRHLATLKTADSDEINFRNALLRLRVGDMCGAKLSVQSTKNPRLKSSLDALLEVADGDFTKAVALLQGQPEDNLDHAMVLNNLAVALLYTGHIGETKLMLEKLTQQHPAFPASLFNLSTIYELCAIDADASKTNLAVSMAAKRPYPDSGGWERAPFEIKL